MIVSASRRTDLPAHYAKWLGERAKAGYLLVRHPRRYHQVYRLDLQRGVDGLSLIHIYTFISMAHIA